MKDMKSARGLNQAEQVKFKTTGVLVHGYGYYLYVADPTLSGNANFNLDCLHRTVSRLFTDLLDPDNTELTEWPSELYIQVDGGSDNKARPFFAYADWLVKSGRFDVVYISFLLVGHTHADYDRYFVPITMELRKEKVCSLDDLLKIYKKAYQKEAPKVIEHVKSVPDYFAWFKTAWQKFKGFARRVPDEERPHQFVFEKDGMRYRNFSTDDSPWNEIPVNILEEDNLPEGNPPMQPPSEKLLTELAESRKNVFRHFNMPEDAGKLFSEDDVTSMTKIFDQFSTLDGKLKDLSDVQTEMEKDYHFSSLPGRVHITAAAEAMQYDRGVPPIVHSKFSERDRTRLLDLEKLAKQARGRAGSCTSSLLAEQELDEDSGSEEDDDDSDNNNDDDDGAGFKLEESVTKRLSKTAAEVANKIIGQFRETSRRQKTNKQGTCIFACRCTMPY